jgi:hypothetical protein
MPSSPTLVLSTLLRQLTITLVLILMGAAAASAQGTFYVNAGGSGTQSGVDWANAFPALPATLVRGATYYIADGTYPGRTFNTAPSGTSRITIKKATVADHGTNTGWTSTLGDGTAVFTGTLTFLTSYWTLDGQTRNADWRSGYGFKVDPPGGSYGITLGVNLQTVVHYITIRYVEVQGSGDRTNTVTDRGIQAYPGVGGSSDGPTNLVFQYLYVHDVGNCPLHLIWSDTTTIEYSVIARNQSDASNHSEGIAFFGGARNATVRYNVFEDIEGTAYIATPTVGHPGCGGWVGSNWYVYGNSFGRPSGSSYSTPGNGVLYIFDTRVTGKFVFTNNTVHNLANGHVGNSNSTSAGCVDTAIFQNNLFYRVTGATLSSTNVTSPTISHNAFFETSATGSNAYSASGSPFTNFAAGNLALTATVAGTMPAGVALSSPYNIDPNGVTRGGDGKWDRGKHEFGGVAAPAPPLNIRIFR